MADKSLPVLRGPVDRLRDGAVAFKDMALKDHPVETIQRTHFKNQFNSDLYMLERVHGHHAAWEKKMDRAVLSQVQRLPGGPPSSHALIDTLMGRDDKMDFEDVLGQPELRPQMPKTGVHEAVEAKLKF